MHEGQVHVTSRQVAELVADAFPELAGTAVRRVAGAGTVNAIFRVGMRHVARLPLVPTTPERDEARLRAEQRAMADFHAVAPVATPAPVGVSGPGAGFPTAWALQTWVEGVTASFDEPADVARELAEVVRRCRAEVRGPRPVDRDGRGGDLRRHDRWVETCIARSAHLVEVAEVRRTWDRLRSLPREATDVLTHGDLVPGNVLVGDGHLRGLLDTGSAGPADPALDLVAAWHLFDETARATFRATVGCTDLEWERGRAWALEQALGAAWYYEATNPAMHALGMSTLRRVLSQNA